MKGRHRQVNVLSNNIDTGVHCVCCLSCLVLFEEMQRYVLLGVLRVSVPYTSRVQTARSEQFGFPSQYHNTCLAPRLKRARTWKLGLRSDGYVFPTSWPNIEGGL